MNLSTPTTPQPARRLGRRATKTGNVASFVPTPHSNESASHIVYTVGKKLAVLGYALKIVAGTMVIMLILGSTMATAASLACTFLAAIVVLALASGYLQEHSVVSC